jgi:hypothetical protein
MVYEIGVQRVVARDQDGQRLVAIAPGAPGLLPQRRAGAGPAADDHGVQPDKVDAELQRIGRGEAEQLAGVEGGLQLAPLLAQVATPVGGDPRAQPGDRLVERPPRHRGHGLGASPGADERQRAHTIDYRVGEEVGTLAQRGSPHGRRVAAPFQGGQQRRLPQRERHPAARRRVVRDGLDHQAGEPLGRRRRVTRRGGGQHEGGGAPVAVGHPAEAAQHVGDVRAEDAAIGVALVYDDVAQAPQEGLPRRVPGQDAVVQHVRVGQHEA